MNPMDRLVSLISRCVSFLSGYSISRVKGPETTRIHDGLVKKIFYESGIFDSKEVELSPLQHGSVAQSVLCEFGRQREPVGAITLIQNDRQLPVQEYFNIRIPADVDRSQLAELTRYVISNEHRGVPIVSNGLLNAAFDYSKQNGIRWWVCCFPSVLAVSFKAFFQQSILLEQHELTPEHREKRRGREAYFAKNRAVCVLLIDLHSVSKSAAAIRFFKRLRSRNASKRRQNGGSVASRSRGHR